VTEGVVVAEAELVAVVVHAERLFLVACMLAFVVGDQHDLEYLQKPRDRKAHVGVVVVVVELAAVCVHLMDSHLLILFHLGPCNYLTEFDHR
jgi:hypothetical protein